MLSPTLVVLTGLQNRQRQEEARRLQIEEMRRQQLQYQQQQQLYQQQHPGYGPPGGGYPMQQVMSAFLLGVFTR